MENLSVAATKSWFAFFFCKGPNSLVRELLSLLYALRLGESLIFLIGDEAVEEGRELRGVLLLPSLPIPLKYLVKIVDFLGGRGSRTIPVARFLVKSVGCLDGKCGSAYCAAGLRC